MDMDTARSTSDENPSTDPKVQVPRKVSFQMPTDDWLCKKLSKLNLTLVEGYPSHRSEAGGLLKNQFIGPANSQANLTGCILTRKLTLLLCHSRTLMPQD